MELSESAISQSILGHTRFALSRLKDLTFKDHFVYSPLEYAWEPYAEYVERYLSSKKKVLYWGMNPGPFGMVQTGIPFGDVPSVRDWMTIEATIQKPSVEHPKKPVQGFACSRREISGKRLWAYFASKYLHADAFFKDQAVLNYCPLAFLRKEGLNCTPEKLPRLEKAALFEICDEFMKSVITELEPSWVVAIGNFVHERIVPLVDGHFPSVKVCKILHPSPANPHANRNWSEKVDADLTALYASVSLG